MGLEEDPLARPGAVRAGEWRACIREVARLRLLVSRLSTQVHTHYILIA